MGIRFFIWMTALCGVLFAGCEKEEYTLEETFRMTVASVRPIDKPELYQPTGESWFRPVYICKRGDGDWEVWSAWSPIRGFDELYEVGYEYVIEVQRWRWNDPPMDANNNRFVFRRLVSKERKQSEGIPEFFLTE